MHILFWLFTAAVLVAAALVLRWVRTADAQDAADAARHERRVRELTDGEYSAVGRMVDRAVEER